MANKQLQLRRGSAVDHTTTNGGFVGAEGEITMDLTTNSVRVHDGNETGGYELLRADMSNVAATGSTITIDAKVVLSDNAYATQNGDSSLTLATKGWVSSQASSGGLVGVLDNVGDVEIGTKASTDASTLSTGQFLIYDSMTVDGSTVERWTNKSVSGVVNFTSEGVTSFTSDAINGGNIDTITDGVIPNAKLVHSTLTVSDSTDSGDIALGGTLTVTGIANEITVTASTLDGSLSIGIVDAPVLGDVTAGTLSVTNDLTVGGNLTVSGTTTTINTETINLADNIIELNSNLTTETPSQNAGIEINRGTLSNVSLIWDETGDNWQVTEDGTNFYNIVHVGDSKSIDTGMIADEAIETLQIQGLAVTAAKIANLTITDAQVANNAISSTKLSDFTDTLAKTSGNLMVANGSTLTSLPTAGDVTVTGVTGSTITFTISADAIDTSKIADNAGILGTQLANLTITRDKLSTTAGSKITANQLEDNAVGTAQILNNTVNEHKLTATVAGDGLTGGNGSALTLDLSSVTDASISVADDSIAFLDVTTTVGGTLSYATRTESVADLVNAFSGTHMTATDGVLAIDNFTGVTAGSITPSKAVLVDANSDIRGFGIVAATTFSGTLSGQVSTAEQSSITSTPNLATVGALSSGSIVTGFGSINVGNNSVDAGTITASLGFVGNVTGDVVGDLTGDVLTASQPSITTMSNLVTVGALNSGSITTGFSSIDVGQSAISGGTITGARITDGTASLQGGTLTANKAVIDSLTVDNGVITQSTGALSISSTDNVVNVESVQFSGDDVTGVATLNVANTVTATTFLGNLAGTTATLSGTIEGNTLTDGTATLTSGAVTGLTQAVIDQLTIDNTSITQAGTLTNLTISAVDGTVTVDGVVFDAGAVTSVTSLTAANEITATTFTGTLSTAAQPNVTAVGTLVSLDVDDLSLDAHTISSSTLMQISAGLNKAVTIESVSINDGAVSGISTLAAGTLTLSGDIAVNGGDITSTSSALNISAASSVNVESVNFADGVITNATSLTASGTLSAGTVTDGVATLAAGTLSGATKIVVDELTIDDTSITQAGSGGAKNLTVSASNGNVLIEDVTFNGGAVTNVTNLTASNVITANTFVGAFSGEVSSDVLTASTLTVTTQFKLDSAAFYIDSDPVTATATEINRLASIDTSNDTAGKLAIVNSDGYIHGSFKSLSSQGGTGALLQNVLFDVRDVNGNTVFKIDPVSSDETIVKTARLAVDDSLLQVNANTSTSVVDNQHDIGIFGNLGAGKAAAVVYDRSDAAWKLVDDVNVPENAINTIDPTDAQLSNLEVKGIRTTAGVQRAVATATQSGETLSSANHVWFQDASSYFTLNVPDAALHTGREFVIRNTAGLGNDLTISSIGGNIEGTASPYLLPAESSATLISDGSDWWVI